MAAILIVHATVLLADRDAFETWYQTEHLPEARVAFQAIAATRGWSDDGVHVAIYQFEDIDRARAVANSDELKNLIAEFDRVWQGRVTRTREFVDIRQEILQ